MIRKTNKKLAALEAENTAKEEARVKELALLSPAQTLDKLDSSTAGLSEFLVNASRSCYGKNQTTQGKKNGLFKRLLGAFVNPFSAILTALGVLSLFTDVIFAPVGDKNPAAAIIVFVMVTISGVLRFVQETRSGRAAAGLSELIKTKAEVVRKNEGTIELPIEEIVVGDIVLLAAGDVVPADLRLLSAKDLFVNQSALTGESEPVEKRASFGNADDAKLLSLSEIPTLAFAGSAVVAGSASCVAVAVGDNTVLGRTAKKLSQGKREPTSFEKGVSSVSHVLLRFMAVMVPVVLLVNGFTKGDWLHAFLFAVSVAVGLTPEMLPVIVTTCLAKGAVAMAKKKTVVKNLDSIQNLGCIDILCTDKTGTLTQDEIILEYHLDVHGDENARVLRYAFLNAYYQTGLRSRIDFAVIERTRAESVGAEELRGLENRYSKTDEIPFDFERRRLSVVVRDEKTGKTQLVTKGAAEEMLSVCSFAEYEGEVQPLTRELRAEILQRIDSLNDQGLRVLVLARKDNPAPAEKCSPADESDMVLMGYLAFLDPPKESAKTAIAALKEYGVATKILTGDNERVALRVCRQVGLNAGRVLLGSDVDKLDDKTLFEEAEKTDVFAKLSPAQKARIVTALRSGGHSVGFLGDGINDAEAMRAADVGISVDSGADIAKEAADVVLLEKDLNVLEAGILEGRKVYANMLKYIRMTASSNFGNMFSVLTASAFLPFLPMESLQLLFLNLLYDITCTTVPWDNADKEFLLRPKKWDASSTGKFMLFIGPVSSVFDILCFAALYFIVCPQAMGGAGYRALSDAASREQFAALFQSGWFILSMWTQALAIHMIRTPKIPFIQSRASLSVTLSGLAGCVAATVIPFTPLGAFLGFAPLPAVWFLYLTGIVAGYMIAVTLVKNLYVKKYGNLL